MSFRKVEKRGKSLFFDKFRELVVLLIIFGLLYSTVFFVKSLQGYFKKDKETKELTSEIISLDKKFQERKLEISYMKTDEFLEIEARKRYLVKKNNETVVALPNILNREREIFWKEKSQAKKDNRKNWEKWKELFF